METAELMARAQRAYETGRFSWALRVAWLVLPLVALSLYVAHGSSVSLVTGLVLLVTTTLLRWRGQVWTLAVRTGLVAGFFPFVLLLGLKCSSSYFCALGGCMAHCTIFCGVGGVAAGLLLATRARQLDGGAVPFLIAGTAVAALTGLFGCFVGGLTGVAWMAAGEIAATIPGYVFPVRRR